ncbi:MAG: hypothetical protein ACSLFB_11625 [Acidimicrobiales bacterium]
MTQSYDAAGATPPESTDPSESITLTEVIDGYRDSGFAGDFWAEDPSSLRCGSCDSVLDARRVPMHSMRRMEGASDPDDMVVVVASTCPVCGARGTAVLGYGSMATITDADVLVALQDRRCDDVLPGDSSTGEKY